MAPSRTQYNAEAPNIFCDSEDDSADQTPYFRENDPTCFLMILRFFCHSSLLRAETNIAFDESLDSQRSVFCAVVNRWRGEINSAGIDLGTAALAQLL
jgi:hypothetical protein